MKDLNEQVISLIELGYTLDEAIKEINGNYYELVFLNSSN